MRFDQSSDTKYQSRVRENPVKSTYLIDITYLGCSDYAPQNHLDGYPPVWAELLAEHLRRKLRAQETSIEYSLPDVVICEPLS